MCLPSSLQSDIRLAKWPTLRAIVQFPPIRKSVPTGANLANSGQFAKWYPMHNEAAIWRYFSSDGPAAQPVEPLYPDWESLVRASSILIIFSFLKNFIFFFRCLNPHTIRCPERRPEILLLDLFFVLRPNGVCPVGNVESLGTTDWRPMRTGQLPQARYQGSFLTKPKKRRVINSLFPYTCQSFWKGRHRSGTFRWTYGGDCRTPKFYLKYR